MAAVSAAVNIYAPPCRRELHIFSTFPIRSGTSPASASRFGREHPVGLFTPSRRTAAIYSSQTPYISVEPASTTSAGGWEDFAEKVSGEWDGFGADFTAEGKPIHLPESVVPEAFREWDVEVFDWQTQSPTLAQSQNNYNPSLIYKTIKLLPTVGCEADAATVYSTLERNVTVGHDSPFAYQSTGSYVALWPTSSTDRFLALEHCLVNPDDKESRVRVIQTIELQPELKLRSIQVFAERWYGPFRNGEQLGGCAIRDSAFAASEPLNASQVSSEWQAFTSIATFDDPHKMIQLLEPVGVCQTRRNVSEFIFLPKQLWCSTRRAENGGISFEVGWLLGQGRSITSKCTFSSTAQLQEITMASETVTQE